MSENIKAIETIWDQLTARFSNLNGLKPSTSWFKSGMSERVGHKRVRLLEGRSQARFVSNKLRDLSLDDINYLSTRSIVNLEQAQSAARTTTVLNTTIVIGAIVIFNQIFPGMISDVIKETLSNDNLLDVVLNILISICSIALMIGVTAFSHAGAAQARDLKHLLDLELGRRHAFVKSTPAHGSETGIVDDLKDNFISDV